MVKKSHRSDIQDDINDQHVQQEISQDQPGISKEQEEQINTQEAGKEAEPDFEEKLAELQNKYLRLSAEFDNYRKRTIREKADLQIIAREDILSRILPVIDDFERGMDIVEKSKDIEAVKEGLRLIFAKFSNFLSQQGVKEIEALNKDFDTEFHEAITKIPVDNKKKKGKVVDVVEKGYILREKVIRYAKVVIGE